MRYRTHLYVEDADIKVPLIIEYTVHRAFKSPSREEPDEPAHCEIQSVIADVPVPLIGFANVDWLIDELNADSEMQAALFAHQEAES